MNGSTWFNGFSSPSGGDQFISVTIAFIPPLTLWFSSPSGGDQFISEKRGN